MLFALIAAVTFAAGVIRGLTGFGGPLLLVPVFSYFYDPGSAIASIMLIDFSANVSLLRDAVREANWHTISMIVAGAILTLPLGGYAMVHTDPRIVRDVVYSVVGIMSVILLTGWQYSGVYSTPRLLGAGAINGLIVGATAVGVALYPVMLGGKESSRVSRANFVLWAFFCSVGAFGVVLVGGKVGTVELSRAALYVPIYALGVHTGKRFFHRIDDTMLKRVVLFTLIGIAVVGLSITQ